MTPTLRLRPRALLRPLAVVLLAGALFACGGKDTGGGETQRAVRTGRVRVLVTQFAAGRDPYADDAAQELSDLGMRAKPALLQIIRRDPTITPDELDALMVIVDGYAPDPELFDALRARINDNPDAEERRRLLASVDALQKS